MKGMTKGEKLESLLFLTSKKKKTPSERKRKICLFPKKDFRRVNKNIREEEKKNTVPFFSAGERLRGGCNTDAAKLGVLWAMFTLK